MPVSFWRHAMAASGAASMDRSAADRVSARRRLHSNAGQIADPTAEGELINTLEVPACRARSRVGNVGQLSADRSRFSG